MTHWLITFIENYGYLAIFFGSSIEGETTLVLGGLAAHDGYLELRFVFLIAILGAIIGDLLWFTLGRIWGVSILKRWPRLQKWAARPMGAISARPGLLSFLMRFFYGLRNVVPFSIGMSSISTKRFLVFNTAGAVVWGIILVGLGYFIGEALQGLVGHLKRIEFALVVIVLLIAAILHEFRNLSQLARKKLGLDVNHN